MIRRVVGFIILTLVLSLVGTVVFLLVRGSLPVGVHVALILVPVLASLPVTFGFVKWSKAIGLRAFETGGRLCWSCGYVLTGLADEGACPECGNWYSLEDLKAKWRTTRLGPIVRDEGKKPPKAIGTTASPGAPRFLRRRLVLFIIVMCFGPLLMVLTALGGLVNKVGPWLPWVIGFQTLLIAAFVTWFLGTHRLLMRRLRETHNRLCFSCGYDVSTLGECGRCPECGEAFEHEDLRRRWLDVHYAPRERLPRRER